MNGGIFFAPGERGGIPVLPDQYGRWGAWKPAPKGTPPSPEPERPRGSVIQAPPPAPAGPPQPSFCLGAETTVCGEQTPYVSPANICRAAMNGVCLLAGLGVMFGLLGLSINALIRS